MAQSVFHQETRFSTARGSVLQASHRNNVTDLFSPEIFHLVLKNPATSHSFLRFCKTRNCGGNIEFLRKVEEYHRLVHETNKLLSDIHVDYIASGASYQLDLPPMIKQRLLMNLKAASQSLLPELEDVFTGATKHIERSLSTDIYPRFVKHQVTLSASSALSSNRERFPGLGDCFCLTNPRKADNPIIAASDGFVHVTGYERSEIVTRNCRFLQGEGTDRETVQRLGRTIVECDESVEFLLNYRKDGEPFWNLLYICPLLNERGDLVFYLGGQVNCSGTIHSRMDVLSILSLNEDKVDLYGNVKDDSYVGKEKGKKRASFFKTFKKWNVDSPRGLEGSNVRIRKEPGMENELIGRLGTLNYRTQVEEFHTAYSKYMVLRYEPIAETLTVSFFSPSIIDLLDLHLPNGTIVPIYNEDLFRMLHEPSAVLEKKVKEEIRAGRAVSVDTGLMTGFKNVHRKVRLRSQAQPELKRLEGDFTCHFTPLKDENGFCEWVVLCIGPKEGSELASIAEVVEGKD